MQELNITELKNIFNECLDIAKIKNKDYGCQTILDFKELGIIIRLNDKMHRLKNLIQTNEINVKTETIEDTAKDMINYAAYLIMLQRGVLIDTHTK